MLHGSKLVDPKRHAEPADAREAFWEALGTEEAEVARARGWTLLQCAGALSYYTPENNPSLYHEAETWLALVLSDGG